MPIKLNALAVRTGELLSYGAGLLLTGFFVVSIAQGEVERQGDIAAFEEQLAMATEQAASASATPVDSGAAPAAASQPDFENVGAPDTSLWAPGRIKDYEESLKAELPPVLGVLEIGAVGLKVPVYSTATDLVMDRGAGVIDGMAYPHEEGNIGISGHRDGYFRVLKDVKLGDTIVLQTLEGEKRFSIEATKIVEIEDTELLQDTWDRTILTLVTCYPFYFVGHAPQRFIVTASLDTTNVNQN